MKLNYCAECANTGDGCEVCSTTQKGIPSQFKSKFTTTDNVNHPSHYATGKFECIEVMREIYGDEEVKAFCLLNAFKYLYRCEGKGKKSEDIEKANFYLNKYIEIERGKNR